MSIEKRMGSFSRSVRTLIISVAPEEEEIKVLTDLRAFLCPLGAIDMQVLTDLKSQEVVSPDPFGLRRSRTTVARGIARDRPSPYDEGRDVRRTVARGPVPRKAWPPCCRCTNRFFFARHLFRSFRTYMSIEKRVGFVFKVR